MLAVLPLKPLLSAKMVRVFFPLRIRIFRISDSRNGELLKSVKIAHENNGLLAISPDGSMLAEYEGSTKQARVTDIQTNNRVTTLQATDAFMSVTKFSADGTMLAGADTDRLIRVWDVRSGSLRFTLTGHQSEVEGLRFSKDGKRLASCSYEGIRIWSVETGTQLTLLEGHESVVKAVDFGSNNNLVVSGAEDSTVRTWNVASAATISLPYPGRIGAVAISRDGKYAVIGEKNAYDKPNQVVIYELGTLRVLRELIPHVDDIIRVDFSPDGQHFAVADAVGVVRIFDFQSGELFGTIKGKHPVSGVAFSPDGRNIAIGTKDGYVSVWSVKSWETVWSIHGHKDIVGQLDFSFDGNRLVSGSWDKSAKIWETATGRVLNILTDHGNAVLSVAFSPKGDRVVSGSLDTTVKIWDLTKDAKPQTLPGHTYGVSGVVFSHDGKRVFSVSPDMSLRLWDAESGELITVLRDVIDSRDWGMEGNSFNTTIRTANGIQSLTLSADGARLIAAVPENVKYPAVQSLLMIWNTGLPENRKVVYEVPGQLFEVERLWGAFTSRYQTPNLLFSPYEIWSTSWREFRSRTAL